MKCSVTLYSSLFLVILHLLTCSNNYLGTFLRNSRGDSLKTCILSHFNEYGVATLAQARKSAKTAESSLPKDEVPSTSALKPDRPPVKKCTLYGKHHHEAKDCWLNPESEIGKRRAAQGKTAIVAVTTPTTAPTGPRKYPSKGEPRRIHPCSICQEEHLTY